MLTIWYHRDFDGIASAAILADVLRDRCGRTEIRWSGVNHDRRQDWASWGSDGKDFAVVDFFFHPKATYWFDHHPTTFLTDEYKKIYVQSDRWRFDPTSPSCPPLILRHAEETWDYKTPPRYRELADWSNVIDAAKFSSAEEALFGDAPALRIMRALTVAPHVDWSDDIVTCFFESDLETTARKDEIEKRYQRACRNRDTAMHQFQSTVIESRGGVLLYDASSDKVRRERFAPFYFYPQIHYAVGLLPTRAGLHITAAENPWNSPHGLVDVGGLCEKYGGGGHRAVGGANPASYTEGRRAAREIAEELRRVLQSTAKG